MHSSRLFLLGGLLGMLWCTGVIANPVGFYGPLKIFAPPNITVELSNRVGTPVSVGNPTLTGGEPLVTVASNPSTIPTTFPLGATIITWTATDANGATSSASCIVTVKDTTKPSITAPVDKAVTQTSINGTSVDLGTPIVSDICDAAPTVTNDAPSLFQVGTTIVSWTATDHSGNSATATQRVTVTPLPSKAFVHVYTESELTNEKYGPIGGQVYVVLKITLSPGESVTSAPSSVHILEDVSTSVHPVKECDFNFGAWQISTDGNSWSNCAGITENIGTIDVYYRAVANWVTTYAPLGHNGNHKISCSAVTFYNGTNNFTNGPSLVNVEIKNITIKNVNTNANNADYILLDPLSNDNSLKQPSITFTIDDSSIIGNTYSYYLWIRDTQDNDWDNGANIATLMSTSPLSAPGTYTATWNGLLNDGSTAKWGTYTFRLLVFESDGDAEFDKLETTHFSQHILNTIESDTEDSTETLRMQYLVCDLPNIQPVMVGVDVRDPSLNLLSSNTDLQRSVTSLNVSDVYTYSDSDGMGTYITLLVGCDGHGAEYRDHTNKRMLTVNSRPVNEVIWSMNGMYNGGHWKSVRIKRKFAHIATEFKEYGDPALTVLGWVKSKQPATVNTGSHRKSAAINGGLFAGFDTGSPLGFLGTGSKKWDTDPNNPYEAQGFPPTGAYGDVDERWGFYFKDTKDATANGDYSIGLAKDIHRPKEATSWYDNNALSDNFPYGFSGVGCLRSSITSPLLDPDSDQCSSWPAHNTDSARTLLGWTFRGINMYFIVCDGGWTWNDAVNFTNNRNLNPDGIGGVIDKAMMFDGGGSSVLVIRYIPRGVAIETGATNSTFGVTERKPPTCVRAYCTNP